MKMIFQLLFGVYSPLNILGFVFKVIMELIKALVTLIRMFKGK